MPQPPVALPHAQRAAQALRDRGELDRARSVLEDALDEATAVYPEGHPDVLAAAHLLAGMHREAGEPTAARRVLEDALGGTAVGPADRQRLAMAFDLAAIAEELGNRHEARRNYGWVVEAGATVLGASHPMVLAAGDYLARQAGGGSPGPAGSAARYRFPPPPAEVGADGPRYPGPSAAASRPFSVPPHPTAAPPPHPSPAPPPFAEPRHTAPAAPAPFAGSTPTASPPFTCAAPTSPAAPAAAARPSSGPRVPAPPAPAVDRPRRPPRRAQVLTAVVGVVAVAALAVAGVALLRDRPGPPAGGTIVYPTAPPMDPPAEVRLRDEGTAITLTWADPAGGTVSFIVAGGRAGEQSQVMGRLDPGRETYTVNGLNPELEYCFAVVAVYSVDDLVPSELVCTRRAGATPTPQG